MKDSYVVDASSVIKLLVEESGGNDARAFFGRLTDPSPPSFYAPDLLYVECANTIWKYVTRHHYAPRSAQMALQALRALALESIPTQRLFQEAFHLSIRHGISAYDACYVVLAEQIVCPLITEDSRLIHQIRPHTKIPLYSLADVV